ncbi:MAG: hypothetical protein JXQ79_09015 [Rhodobacteraceae bacterium]|nr:hypothetical protein [Paracoccaceae bacterium]
MGGTPVTCALLDQRGPAQLSRNVMFGAKTEIAPVARRMVATGGLLTRL